MNKKIAIGAIGVIFLVFTFINIYYFYFSKITLNFYSHIDVSGSINESINAYEKMHPRIKIKITELPENTDQKLQVITANLALRNGSVDIIDSDVIWPPIFVKNGLIEDLTPYFSAKEQSKYLQAAIESSTVDSKIYGIPYRIDSGLLFYRADLLKKYNLPVPKTMDQLISYSKIIMAKEKGMYGFAASWKQFEGLTCNFFEFASSLGVDIYDSKSKLVASEKQITNTINKMQELIYVDKIVPESSLSYGSGELRNDFINNKLIFMRDWPAGWKAVQDFTSPIAGKVGVAMLPSHSDDIKTRGTLGGWQYTVSKYSNHKAESVEFIKFLTNDLNQLNNAKVFKYLPSSKAVYNNPNLATEIPFINGLDKYFNKSNPRPRKPNYDQLSQYIQNSVHDTLSNSIDSKSAGINLYKQLMKID